ncbi:uncharacterized protein [Amphiura filiformis]|uniref:uncharacterized protein n=1 Tax=Amphiura filiformis TaxID=82378 RepID=UPI003B22796A
MGMNSIIYDQLANSSVSWICANCGLPTFSDSFFDNNYMGIPVENSFEVLSDDSDPTDHVNKTNSSTGNSFSSHDSSVGDSVHDGSPKEASTPVANKNCFDDKHQQKSRRKLFKNCPKKKPVKEIKILNLNFQSLKNKQAEFQVLLETEKPDVIIGSETWLNSSVNSCELFPSEYTVFRKDREDGYGGVLIAVRNLPAIHLDELDVNAELLWVRIEIANSKPLFVCAYYNPHTSRESLEQLDQSLAYINSLRVKPSTIWLAGDFNLRDIDWPTNSVKAGSPIATQCKTFLDMCTTYHFQQMVTEPTRGDKILDLFLTTNETQITQVENLPGIGVSDHSIVKVISNIKPVHKKQPPREIFLYSKADLQSIKKDLNSFGKTFIENIDSFTVQENWTSLKTNLSDLMTKHIPKKRVTTRHNLPWFSTKLKRMHRKLRRLYNHQRKTKSVDDEKKFKEYRTKYKKELRHAQMSHIHDSMGRT